MPAAVWWRGRRRGGGAGGCAGPAGLRSRRRRVRPDAVRAVGAAAGRRAGAGRGGGRGADRGRGSAAADVRDRAGRAARGALERAHSRGAAAALDLVRLLDPSSPTRSPLLVDERVLHHLAGAGHLDEDLAALGPRWPRPGGCRPSWPLRGAVAAAWRRRPGGAAARPAAGERPGGGGGRGGGRVCTRSRFRLRDLPGDAAGAGPSGAPDGAGDGARRSRLGGGAVRFGARPDEAAGLGRSLLGFDGPLAVLAGAGAGPSPEAVPVRCGGRAVERLTLAERRQTLRMTLRQNGCLVPAAETTWPRGCST